MAASPHVEAAAVGLQESWHRRINRSWAACGVRNRHGSVKEQTHVLAEQFSDKIPEAAFHGQGRRQGRRPRRASTTSASTTSTRSARRRLDGLMKHPPARRPPGRQRILAARSVAGVFGEVERNLTSERTPEGLARGQILGAEARPPRKGAPWASVGSRRTKSPPHEHGGWWTHGLPPQSGTVAADAPPSASPRSAVPAGTTSAPAGGTPGETRCPSQAFRLQVVAAHARRSPTTKPAAARPRAWPSDSPRRRGRVDAWLDQPPHNRLRPSPAAVAAVPWQPHRPPPSRSRRGQPTRLKDSLAEVREGQIERPRARPPPLRVAASPVPAGPRRPALAELQGRRLLPG